MEKVIETRNLSFSYTDKEKILSDINIEIEKGSFTAVLGSNGSGKSTLAKHFNAILLPEGGQVYVCGMDTSKQASDVRSKAGMVFQNPDNQFVASIVEDDAAFGAENLGIEPEEIRKRVDCALEAVKLSDYAESLISSLSGGQKQKAAIAGVLAMEPEIIILDEATAMLDPAGRKEVLKTVKKLNREKNITVILITHYMEEAVTADRIVVLEYGRIALDGTPKEVFGERKKIRLLGLDVPQAAQIASKLRERGMNIPETVLTVEECADAVCKAFGGINDKS